MDSLGHTDNTSVMKYYNYVELKKYIEERKVDYEEKG